MPVVKPETTPVVAPIVATEGVPLVHVPEVMASPSVVVVPRQMESIPKIGDMAGADGMMLTV